VAPSPGAATEATPLPVEPGTTSGGPPAPSAPVLGVEAGSTAAPSAPVLGVEGGSTTPTSQSEPGGTRGYRLLYYWAAR
jgi:hypothetical protein